MNSSDNYVHNILKKIGIVILCVLIALIIGAMIGFGIGGGNPFAVFLPSTWAHIAAFLK
ncbi:MAG: DNA-directed RNA polymerase subunit beta [Candidatus Paralactobacillus gallistercoris]|uniref:DNA-directed RNA polymerase subunit beta n=1 Tax=Candidatus Paralactobacillus gallistercoris TaxID=2838724 RepID=A0A948TKS2_9LACO|nr:DNA-directed RNA polymerase subunit beta [Candidatus Paralactobacillus gallistercoris]